MSPRKVCVLAVLGVMGFWPGWARAQGSLPGKAAAVVNGEPIPESDVKTLLDSRPQPYPQSEAQKRENRKAALEILINDTLLRQFLRKNAPPADPAQVNKLMADLNMELKGKGKTLKDFLKEAKQTEEQVRADAATQVQMAAYLKIRFPDSAVKKYYDDNKVFFDKVYVRASHILVKVPARATQAEKDTARNKLLAIRQEILAGRVSFEDAARKYSECPSKSKGGDLGMFPYKFAVVEPFSRAAFALNKNQMSDLVLTDFGYHLIKVTDRTPGEPSNFAAIKDEVRNVYAEDTKFYQQILDRERQTARIEIFMK